MDILLDNPLATMYGPYFLLLYGFVVLFTVLFLALAKSLADKTDRLPMPPIPTHVDPYEIAYLRGGGNELARAAIFSLLQKGLLEIRNDGRRVVITRTAAAPPRGTTVLEDAVMNWFSVSRSPKSVFTVGGLTAILEPYIDEYKLRLERQYLITGPEIKRRLALFRWAAYLVVFGLGAYKAAVAIATGHTNLIGLAIIGIIGLVGITLVARPRRLTSLGEAWLERVQIAFGNLKKQPAWNETHQPDRAMPAENAVVGFDPLLLSVGVFGCVILTGTAYGAYNDIFAKSQTRFDGSGYAGCGAGCGSDSGGGSSCSSGGSSCGSSGCGGGCGGCGGS